MSPRGKASSFIRGLALSLVGSIAATVGATLVLAAVASAFTGNWGGHASELSLFIFGLLIAIPGILAMRRGYLDYRSGFQRPSPHGGTHKSTNELSKSRAMTPQAHKEIHD